ncbi:MAG: GtrA family protein [Bacteroidetes bacterium]|nr:MAG: GtrA family protein [Bacteroidota bacterium]
MIATLFKQTFYHPRYGQFMRFAFIGGTCLVLEMGLFVYLSQILGKEYIYHINVFAISMALLLNYIVSRFWVFEAGRHSLVKEFLIFVAVGMVAIKLSNTILWIGMGSLMLDYITAKILAVFIVLFWNFVMKKFFVFKR